jgi:hypothetical protein
MDKIPPPIPMQDLSAIVRTASEECQNRVDQDPTLRSVTVATPYGTFTCRKSAKGAIYVSIKPVPVVGTVTEFKAAKQ